MRRYCFDIYFVLILTGAICISILSCSSDSVPIRTNDTESEPTTILTPNLNIETLLDAQEATLVETYERLVASVVHIITTQEVQSGRGNQAPFGNGEGSGFVWDASGHLVTNHHVVAGADQVTIEFFDGTELKAEVIGTDPDSDLAVLKVDPALVDLVPITIGDSAAVRVGQTAIAIGSPFSQDFTMTVGIVSAVGRIRPSGLTAFAIPLVIQHDASINPGSSGGPLFDRRGTLIGVNTQIISQSGGSTGIGFAVPVNRAAKVVPSIISDGHYRHPWLGISATKLFPGLRTAADIDTDTKGVMIQRVIPDSPADKAGLTAGNETAIIGGTNYRVSGDTIISIGHEPVRDMDDLINYLEENTKPGDQVRLGVLRGEAIVEDVHVTLAARPSQ